VPLDYDIEEFEDMTLCPFDVPEGQYVFEYYDVFSKRQIFKNPRPTEEYSEWTLKDVDLLLKFIIIVIDQESPIASGDGATDMDYREEQGLLLLKIKEGAPVFEEVKSRSFMYRTLLFEFFKTINSFDYEMWYSLKMNFHSMTAQLRMPLKAGDANAINARRQLAGALPDLQKELMRHQVALFPSKRLEKMIINKMLEEDKVGGYVEEYAKDLPELTGEQISDE
jgi:hypothetical protein